MTSRERAVATGTGGFQPAPDEALLRWIGRSAIRALYGELAAYPKPGLVSPVDSGSHADMDATTFMRSLFALRTYFYDIAMLGASESLFGPLQSLGIMAERRMLEATCGINTHRGAIFNLGLLAAAAGYLQAQGRLTTKSALGDVVRERWGLSILKSAGAGLGSHGSMVARTYGSGGARAEAASGFPHVFQVGLPALREILAVKGDAEAAAVQCFFSLMAVLPDTNLLYRGGESGLAFARGAASRFLCRGGVLQPDWRSHAIAIHKRFVARKLSPGGSADLLAAVLFVQQMEGE